jgi:hypothetical protein
VPGSAANQLQTFPGRFLSLPTDHTAWHDDNNCDGYRKRQRANAEQSFAMAHQVVGDLAVRHVKFSFGAL